MPKSIPLRACLGVELEAVVLSPKHWRHQTALVPLGAGRRPAPDWDWGSYIAILGYGEDFVFQLGAVEWRHVHLAHTPVEPDRHASLDFGRGLLDTIWCQAVEAS